MKTCSCLFHIFLACKPLLKWINAFLLDTLYWHFNCKPAFIQKNMKIHKRRKRGPKFWDPNHKILHYQSFFLLIIPQGFTFNCFCYMLTSIGVHSEQKWLDLTFLITLSEKLWYTFWKYLSGCTFVKCFLITLLSGFLMWIWEYKSNYCHLYH